MHHSISTSRAGVLVAAALALLPGTVAAQTETHQHPAPAAQTSPISWHFMQDGVAWLTYNNQGGPRGGEDFGSQNWWMGMLSRPAAGGTLQFNLMLSLDPLTLQEDGYREIFQVGETLNNAPLIDRQHPHDFLMQASVGWKHAIGRGYSLTLAGAPVGEPALGPVAFMHRASAFENPTAPLAHHTLDSTHIAMGVVTAAVDRGPFQVEGSIFQGREPDEQRWDLIDFGPLDSWSVRGWYRPNDQLSFQLSHGFLTEPEALEEGDIRRTTASAAWTRPHSNGSTATTVAYGRNNKLENDTNAFLAESTHLFGLNAVYGRYEAVQVEGDVLRFGSHGGGGHHADEEGESEATPLVQALTLGGLRTIGRWGGWDLGVGGDVTFYQVPDVLKPTHGDSPQSYHVYLRLRSPAPMGRMVNMVMTKIGH
ncbi:MAG TPA: hypothetical protein VM493_00180 [Vicinamibacterales bacterium]|nr:hypothetical protein [Vicinamibacterales bacterium]